MKDIGKKIEKEAKKNDSLKWWHKNKYTVLRIALFPISVPVTLYDVFQEKRRKKIKQSLVFSEELCEKYLDKMIPKLVVRLCEDSEVFLISNSRGEFGDIEFFDFYHYSKDWKTKMFFGKFNKNVEAFICEKYQISGYSKLTLDTPNKWKEAEKLFEWDNLWAESTAKGVAFYKDSAFKTKNKKEKQKCF